jgi:hypothetical protein
VPFFCHNNGINLFAKLFLSDRVNAPTRISAANLEAPQRSTFDKETMRLLSVEGRHLGGDPNSWMTEAP